jgi:tetratricopeptide (TPR) repeat protein
MPEGAAVYYVSAAQRTLLGETPIDFAKTSLPSDAPFVITFEKEGFDNREIAVTPTDNALTKISVQLNPKKPGGTDEGLKRLRGVVVKIFSIQKMIYQKKYVDALAALQNLAASEPNMPEVFVLRGSVYASLRDNDQARREWETALKLDPALDEVKVALAQLQNSNSGGKP